MITSITNATNTTPTHQYMANTKSKLGHQPKRTHQTLLLSETPKNHVNRASPHQQQQNSTAPTLSIQRQQYTPILVCSEWVAMRLSETFVRAIRISCYGDGTGQT